LGFPFIQTRVEKKEIDVQLIHDLGSGMELYNSGYFVTICPKSIVGPNGPLLKLCNRAEIAGDLGWSCCSVDLDV